MTCCWCENEAQGKYYDNDDNLVEACDDCAIAQPLYDEPSKAFLAAQDEDDDGACRTCGGAGGEPPMSCYACSGRGSKRRSIDYDYRWDR